MKKWLRLIAICGLMLIGAGAVGTALAQPREDHVAYAEEVSEVVFEQKTYIYEAEGEKYTLVLLSETEFSLSNGEEVLEGTYTRIGNNIALNYGGDVLEVAVNEITGTFGEVAEDKEKGWAKQAYETYIVPIFAGVSIVSVGSALFSLLFLFLKNRKLDQKIMEVEKGATEKFNACVDVLDKATEMLGIIEKIYELISHSDSLNDEMKNAIEGKLLVMGEMLEGATKNIDKVNKLCEINALLVQLETKVARQNKDVVRGGVVKDIDEIARLVKEL